MSGGPSCTWHKCISSGLVLCYQRSCSRRRPQRWQRLLQRYVRQTPFWRGCPSAAEHRAPAAAGQAGDWKCTTSCTWPSHKEPQQGALCSSRMEWKGQQAVTVTGVQGETVGYGDWLRRCRLSALESLIPDRQWHLESPLPLPLILQRLQAARQPRSFLVCSCACPKEEQLCTCHLHPLSLDRHSLSGRRQQQLCPG